MHDFIILIFISTYLIQFSLQGSTGWEYQAINGSCVFFMMLNVTIFTQNKLSINVNTKCLNAFLSSVMGDA